MNLYAMGWSDDWNGLIPSGNYIARITSAHRSLYRATSEEGELNCYLSGKFQYGTDLGAEYPAVGDWVVTSPQFIDESGRSAAMIESILPRRTKVSRVSSGNSSEEQVIAANVDYVFIVTSANNDLNLHRLQRYIVLANDGGATPVVVVSKVDLHKNSSELIEEFRRELNGIEILPTSAEDGTGIDAIREYLEEGKTSVFVGSSGVGKSTLVNLLLGEEIQLTSEVRLDDDKGRHTTTSRELFFLPSGGMIIDTPGLREIQVFGKGESIQSLFTSIEELTQKCKFTNCIHTPEQPGCAIQNALSGGEISYDDLESYQKLLREMEYSNRKMDKQEASNAKKRWKQINVNYKKRKKFEGR